MSEIKAGTSQEAISASLRFYVFTADQHTRPNTTAAEFTDDKAILSIHNVFGTRSKSLLHCYLNRRITQSG